MMEIKTQQSNHMVTATIPCLPPLATPLIETLRSTNDGYRPDRSALPTITAQAKAQARTVKIECKAILKPATKKQLAVELAALLKCFYVENLSKELYDVIVRDWMNALGSYPHWAIVKAKTDLHQSSTGLKGKVKPADLALRCQKMISKYTALLGQCEYILNAPVEREYTPPTDEERAEMTAYVHSIKKNLSAGELV